MEMMIIFRKLIVDRSLSLLDSDQSWEDMVARVLDRDIDPFSAAAELVDKVMGMSEPGKMGS